MLLHECDRCYWKGERTQGDSEVSVLVTEGKQDVWKLQELKRNAGRLPCDCRHFPGAARCVLCD